MKKSFFAILAIAACMASCSKVVESPVVDEAISFDNYVGKDAMTKASIITGTAIETVNVNAHLHKKTTTGGEGFVANFMTNQVVKKDGTYTPAKYWPAVDQAVDFVAWVPVTNAEVKDATLTFSVPTDVTAQQDLIVANPVLDQNRADDNQKVNLTFKHLLSRIGFQIVATGLPGADDTVNEVKLTNVTLNGKFASEGTVDMTAATPAVEGPAATTAYVLTGANFNYTDNKITADANNAENSYIMLIPAGNEPENITVTYTVTTKAQKEGEKDVVITNTSVFPLQPTEAGAEKFAYQPGMAYKYIFKITMSAIQFEVVETPWDETNVTPGTDITPKPTTPEPENPEQGGAE